MSDGLRIGYVSDSDPYDIWSWSGSHHAMVTALEAQGARIAPLGKSLRRRTSRLALILRKLTGGRFPAEEPQADALTTAQRWGQAITAELATTPCDVLFAPVASGVGAFVQTTVPIVYLSDATFALMRAYYPEFARLPAEVTEQREQLEAQMISMSSALVYSSAWAGDSAVRDYHASPDRVFVIPFGANLDVVPPAATVMEKPRGSTCRLLFLGRDWERKGGAIAVAAMEALRRDGIEAELTVCGVPAPAGPPTPHVTWLGNLSKRNPRDKETLNRVLLESHLLIAPTRADCTPIAFCEANAFGLPVITTNTGGIPSLVEEGRNGYKLELAAGGEEFARVIADAYRDPERFASLVRSSRAMYEDRLNWRAWAVSMMDVFVRAAGRK